MGLFVYPLIAMEENQIKYGGGGGVNSSTILVNMTRPTTFKAATTTNPARCHRVY